MLIFFWSAVLFQSIFQLRALINTLRYSTIVAKLCAVLFPVLMICLLQLDAAQSSVVAFFVIANFSSTFIVYMGDPGLTMTVTVGLVGGAIMLLSILIRYLYSRHALISFKFRYGRSSKTDGSHNHSRVSTGGKQRRQKIYDKWLLLRLGIGFIALG